VDECLAAVGGPARAAATVLLAAVTAYEQVAEPETRVTGGNPGYRFVHVAGWPASVHYEFLYRRTRGEIGAELHFENEKLRNASDAVREARLVGDPGLPPLVWDQAWGNGKGRLRMVFPENADPELVAQGMVSLIRKSRAIVDRALES
jgi:hypothetical protein